MVHKDIEETNMFKRQNIELRQTIESLKKKLFESDIASLKFNIFNLKKENKLLREENKKILYFNKQLEKQKLKFNKFQRKMKNRYLREKEKNLKNEQKDN